MLVDYLIFVCDFLILILLMAWAWMDRNNIYLKK